MDHSILEQSHAGDLPADLGTDGRFLPRLNDAHCLDGLRHRRDFRLCYLHTDDDLRFFSVR